MSYAIGKIIYGTEIPYGEISEIAYTLFEDPPEDLENHEYEDVEVFLTDLGFNLCHTGDEYPCAWMGFEFCEIRETETVPLNDLLQIPSSFQEEEKNKIDQMIATLPNWVLKKVRPADFYIVWYVS